MSAPSPEVEILLGLGGTFRRVPLASIAAITRVPCLTLRESFSRLVLSLIDHNDETVMIPPGRETTEGGDGSERYGSDGLPTVPIPTVQDKQETVTVRTDPSDAPTHASPPPPTPDSSLDAETLAGALGDHDNLPFLRTLVAHTPPAILRLALDETCARRADLRGPPGAYFTAIIRRLSHTSSYA